jgi:hypothetical protein
MTDEKTPKRKTARPKEKSASKPKAMAMPSTGVSSVEAGKPTAGTVVAPSDRQLMIEREAYLRAERRGFEPGHELEDWLAAEHSLGARADA